MSEEQKEAKPAEKTEQPANAPTTEPTAPTDPGDSLVECPKCPEGAAKVKIGNLKKHYEAVHGEAEFDLSSIQRDEFAKINEIIGQVRAQIGDIDLQIARMEQQGLQLIDQRSALLDSYAKAADITTKQGTTYAWDLKKSATIKVNLPKEKLAPRQNVQLNQ